MCIRDRSPASAIFPYRKAGPDPKRKPRTYELRRTTNRGPEKRPINEEYKEYLQMIPDPENGETSSKSNPARRFLSPFTEDRIRSGQVWLAPHLSLSLQKIEYASENCEQAPIFFRLSLSLQKTGGCSEILENKFSRFRRAFTIFAPETKTIQTYGVQFQRDRSLSLIHI